MGQDLHHYLHNLCEVVSEEGRQEDRQGNHTHTENNRKIAPEQLKSKFLTVALCIKVEHADAEPRSSSPEDRQAVSLLSTELALAWTPTPLGSGPPLAALASRAEIRKERKSNATALPLRADRLSVACVASDWLLRTRYPTWDHAS
ncbi:unnamed protein product [Pleuronectes platessa]|uniref:Uncharacterized protein n=1 Tax=Pleuronectes platessa TaxID=8262 RepID=A0A9N7UUA7_PLEPL|nr:unnamed protein product [Pleuronectes platessa]